MKLERMGKNANATVLTLTDGARVLYSYTTPVAVVDHAGAAYRTSRFYSRTTSKHVNAFLGEVVAQEVEQGVIDAYVQGAR